MLLKTSFLSGCRVLDKRHSSASPAFGDGWSSTTSYNTSSNSTRHSCVDLKSRTGYPMFIHDFTKVNRNKNIHSYWKNNKILEVEPLETSIYLWNNMVASCKAKHILIFGNGTQVLSPRLLHLNRRLVQLKCLPGQPDMGRVSQYNSFGCEADDPSTSATRHRCQCIFFRFGCRFFQWFLK